MFQNFTNPFQGWFSAFKLMMALLNQLPTSGFQRTLFTAGMRLASYNNNLYVVVELSRLGRKQKDFCSLEVKTPPATT